jgi:hypothetical protein
MEWQGTFHQCSGGKWAVSLGWESIPIHTICLPSVEPSEGPCIDAVLRGSPPIQRSSDNEEARLSPGFDLVGNLWAAAAYMPPAFLA